LKYLIKYIKMKQQRSLYSNLNMSAPNIFTSNRFSSLRDDNNSSSSSSFKPQRNNNYNQFRQKNEQYSSIKLAKKPIQVDMGNESLFPSLTSEESTTTATSSQFSKMSYLDHCNKIKAEEEIRHSLLKPGWIQMRYNPCGNRTEVSYNGHEFISKEQYEIDRNAIEMMEAEIREEKEQEELCERLIEDYEKALQEEYNLYGESSIAYQEYVRRIQYEKDYPYMEPEDYNQTSDSDEEYLYD